MSHNRRRATPDGREHRRRARRAEASGRIARSTPFVSRSTARRCWGSAPASARSPRACSRALAARDDVLPVAYALTWRGRDDLARGAAARRDAPRPPGSRPGSVRELWDRGVGWPRAEHWTGPVDVVHALNYVAPPARAPVIVDGARPHVRPLPRAVHPRHAALPAPRSAARSRAARASRPASEFVAAEVRDEFGVRSRPGRRDPLGARRRSTGGDADAGAAARGRRALRARARDGRAAQEPARARRARSTRSRPTIPTCGSSSPVPTAGTRSAFDARASTRAPSRDRIVRLGLRHRRGNAATCSPARPCSRTRRATRASASRRSKRWPCGVAGGRRAAPGRSPRCSATPPCSSIPPTTTSSRDALAAACSTTPTTRARRSSRAAASTVAPLHLGRDRRRGSRRPLSARRMKVALHVGQLFQPVPGRDRPLRGRAARRAPRRRASRS